MPGAASSRAFFTQNEEYPSQWYTFPFFTESIVYRPLNNVTKQEVNITLKSQVEMTERGILSNHSQTLDSRLGE
jgi:hypothetical protein